MKIRAQAHTTAGTLHSERSWKETAVQEAEATLYVEEAPGISELGNLLRDISLSIEQLVLFRHQVKTGFI